MATIYGLFPAAIVQIPLRAMFMLLEQPDCGAWWRGIIHIVLGFGCLDTDRISEGIRLPLFMGTLDLPALLGAGMYGVFYFTFGRSLGHMAVDANIVHHRTGRPMRPWQKAIRSGLQLLNGLDSAFWFALWGLSIASVLIDRQRRRSVYDFVAGTVVVIGEPTEEEPAEAKEGVLSRVMGRLTGRAGAAERG